MIAAHQRSRRRIAVAAASALVITTAAFPSHAATPSALDLLHQVRKRYAAAGAYQDSGALEVWRGGRHTTYRFATARRPGGAFRFTLTLGFDVRRWVVWRDAAGSWVLDSGRGEYRPVPSPLVALAELPAARSVGLETYLLPALLAEGADALPAPAAASLDGPLPCAAGEAVQCWQVAFGSEDGGSQAELLVESKTLRVRSLEVQTAGGAADVATAAAAAGLAPPAPGAGRGEPARVLVTFEAEQSGAAAAGAEVVFTPPAETRRVTEWSAPLDPDARPGEPGGPPQREFGETIRVSLSSFVVRALDDAGEPVLGLGPEDFLVTVGDQRVPVRSVDFFSSGGWAPEVADLPTAHDGAPRPLPSRAEPAPPKVVVLFVQADFNAIRIRGHLKMLPFVDQLLAALPPDDLVAVVSFDSHFKLWQDLTTDHEQVSRAVWNAIHFSAEPPSGRRRPPPGRPSLLPEIDPEQWLDAAWPERALELLAYSMYDVPGEKVVVFLGWGLGRFGVGGVRMRPGFQPAIQALTAVGATVFVLDVTDAAYHSLEIGLQEVAAETGGTYSKTAEFPLQATRRLARTLSSHYVLTIDAANLPEIGGELQVELVGHRGVRLLVRPIEAR